MSSRSELDPQARLRRPGGWEIRQVAADHVDGAYLIARVQGVYVERYGGPDEDPFDPGDFRAPNGEFHVGYRDGQPVACGGWRRTSHPTFTPAPTAEIKRMYVVEEEQRRGLAMRMLTHLEAGARAAGVEALILETGPRQPEALALYAKAGYRPIPGFGHYADRPLARFLGRWLIGP